VHELQIREQLAETVPYNILFLIQENDFDLGSGFTWEGMLNMCDQLHHVLQLKYNG
jgi:hypothetical protein